VFTKSFRLRVYTRVLGIVALGASQLGVVSPANAAPTCQIEAIIRCELNWPDRFHQYSSLDECIEAEQNNCPPTSPTKQPECSYINGAYFCASFFNDKVAHEKPHVV